MSQELEFSKQDFEFLKIQEWVIEKGKPQNNDYEIVYNKPVIEILQKPFDNLTKEEVSFLMPWLKKIKERKNIFASKPQILQLIITRQEDQASEKICEIIKRNEFIYTTKDDLKSEMWIYEEGIYKPNGESHIKEMCRQILGEAYTPQRANKVIAKIQADTFINSDEFFNKEKENLEKIPVNNGILNIFTKELSPFTPNKIFFNKLPLDYVKGVDCPGIKKFFRDTLREEEDAKVMFELLGYSLLKEYRFEKAFMFVGSGRNGKGKTLSLFKRFLGGENCCSIPLGQMKPESTSLCELFGRLVNIAGDLSNQDLKYTGMFKQLCGRDLINAKRKFLRDLIFVNYAKLCFACNDLPRVYDFSEGFWSRWILLEFPYRFVPKEDYNKAQNKENLKVEDTQIIEKITTPEELTGLLNEALKGLDRLLKNQDFSYTKGTGEVKDYWIRKSDSFQAFCLDHLEEQYDSFVSKKELRKKFNQYCKAHKVKGTGDKSIKATLEDLFGAIETRRSIGNDFDRVWEGIKFKDTIHGIHGFSKSIGNGDLPIFSKTMDTMDSYNLSNNTTTTNNPKLHDNQDLEAPKDFFKGMGPLVLEAENE